MKINNALKKGTLLDVIVSNGEILLVSKVSSLNIGNLITEEEAAAVRLLGKALAVVTDSETISLVLNVNYHVHSEFSILDGMSRVNDIAKKSSGVSAITEHGNMYSMLKWQVAMSKAGKKPIFGCEVYAEGMGGEKEAYHLLFLAKNEVGKQNLFTLVSDAYNNFYRKPHVFYAEIEKHHEGLICTSACVGGEISKKLANGNYEGAREVAMWFQSVFGDDFYLEIQRHHMEIEETVNPLILQLGKELGIKVVAANDSHYIDKEDTQAHEMLLCINTGTSMKNPDHFKFDGDGYHFLTDLEMVELFKDIPEVVANTLEFAKKCNLEIETGVYHFPKFDVPEGFVGEEDYLGYLIDEGFKKRFYGTPEYDSEEYRQRIAYEKNVLISMGFAGYFLIVWDYIRFSRENDIFVGPGRGSAVGSLVCYCLEITDLDPIKYDLLFERFLNPERISMPDIDVDFEYERRGEVIRYVKDKYGEECVSRIITFGNLKSRNSLGDASRTLLGDYHLGNEMSQLIPKKPGFKLEDAMEIPEFVSMIESSSDAQLVYESAKKIEDNKRQTGVHACGVIIADAPVKSYTPTVVAKDKDTGIAQTVTQLEEVEDMGLLKMDFLGLKNMSVIANSFRGMNKRRAKNGQPQLAKWRDIPLNDPYPYIPVSEGNCHAIFQIEGEGMRKFMKELFSDVPAKIQAVEEKYQLTGFEFIVGEGDKISYKNEMIALGNEFFDRMIAGISLYRPGPMDYIPDYIKGMLNPSEITYAVESLREILTSTYGVITYQEQVMQIVRKLAGFSMPQADHIRKAMGKKKQAILDEYKSYFISGSGENLDDNGNKLCIKGCVANGIAEEIATEIWDKMKDFAKYAFNKSHAAGYAVIAVTCAWLKYYYPDIYMMAQLNAFISDAKFKGYLSVAKNLGVTILPPDVNKSQAEFFLKNRMELRFGLMGLSGLSKNVSILVKEREENGEFTDFVDFVSRMSALGFNKKGFEAIILAGGCDCFGLTRKTMIENLESLVQIVKAVNKKQEASRDYLFAVDDAFEGFVCDITEYEEYYYRDFLDKEKSVAGAYLSGNPIDEYSAFINKLECSEIGLFDFEEETSCTFAGMIKEVKQLRTKKGNKPMANIVIEDRSGEVPVVIFNRIYENCFEHLEEDAIVVVKGRPNIDDIYGTQVIAESVIPIDILAAASVSMVMVRFEADQMEELTDTLRNYEGDVPAWGYVNNSWVQLPSVSASSPLFLRLQNMYGVKNVAYK